MNPIALLGAGGHALVVAEAATLAGFHVIGAYDDDDHAAAFRVMRLTRLGALSDAAAVRSGDSPRLILALGGLALRRAILDRLASALAARAARVIHPQTVIHASSRIGDGVYIGPGAVVHSFAAVGAHAIVNTGAIIEHECEVGCNVHIAPGAILGGRVRIGADTLVGMGARALPGVSVGSGCTIGAGAVVTRDVPDHTTVAGIPARPV